MLQFRLTIRYLHGFFTQNLFWWWWKWAIYIQVKVSHDVQIVPKFLAVICSVSHLRMNLTHELYQNMGVLGSFFFFRNRYDLLESCLREIMELSIVQSQRDIAPERDFFDRADKMKLSSEIVNLYQNFMDEWNQKHRA